MHIETIPVKIAGDPHFTTNSYVVASSPESDCVVIFDPGDEPELLLEHIGERSLKAILLTHGHYDHIGGVAELASMTSAPIYAHEDDAAWIEQSYDAIRGGYARFAELMNAKRGDAPDIELESEAPSIDFPLVDGDILNLCGIRFEVMHTPGHSPGSSCYYSDDYGVLFSGDTLFKGTCGRTDFVGGNPNAMHDSLARLAQLPPGTVVYPGHEGTTTIGNELRRGLSEY